MPSISIARRFQRSPSRVSNGVKACDFSQDVSIPTGKLLKHTHIKLILPTILLHSRFRWFRGYQEDHNDGRMNVSYGLFSAGDRNLRYVCNAFCVLLVLISLVRTHVCSSSGARMSSRRVFFVVLKTIHVYVVITETVPFV